MAPEILCQSSTLSSALRIILIAQVVEICVTVGDYGILFSYVVFRKGLHKSLEVAYEKEASGCRFKMEQAEEYIENKNYVDLSIEHLKRFLSSVHLLSSFSISTQSASNPINYCSYLHEIKDILETREQLLIVNELCIGFPSQDFTSILLMFDPDALHAVHLKTSSENWRNSNCLEQISNFYPRASITMEASNASDLMFLKDHFIRSEFSCNKFILQCYFNVDDVIGMFGAPCNAEKWYFSSESGDNNICMQHGYFGSESFSSFTFTKVSLDQELNENLPSVTLNLVRLAKNVPPVMTLIIEKSDFPTILALRDTSKDLRDFVVKNRLYCSLIKIKVYVNTIQCTYNIDDQITFPYSDTQSLKKWLKKYCPKHVIIETFSCDFDNFAKMEDLKMFLLSFKKKMAIENLDLEGKSELEFIELMRYLDEKNLRRLKISAAGDHDNNTNHRLMLDQITETAHWKHAVELILEGSKISVSIQKLSHFLKVTAFLDVITVEDLAFFKHTLLPSSLPRNFNLITPSHLDLQSLTHHIGYPVVKNTNGIEYNQWLFPATKFFEILIHKTISGCTCIEMRHRSNKSQCL